MVAYVLPQLRDRLERLRGYLARDPQNVNLLDEAAELAFRLADFHAAKSFLEKALTERPNDPEFRFRLGTVSLAAGESSRARSLFKGLMADGQNHPGILYNLAYALLSEGNQGEALATLDSIAEQARQELPQFNLLKARVLYHAQDFDGALAHLEIYLSGTPKDLDALGLKAQVLFDRDDTEQACEIANELLTLRPDDPAAQLVLGSAALQNRDPQTVEKYLGAVVKLAPNAGRAWSGLGFASLLKNDLEEAKGRFESAVAHMAQHPGTWHGLAWTQILRGDLAAARQALDKAMAVDRNFADNHGSLSVLFILEGQTEEAEAAMKRGLKLDPRSPSSLFARSLLLTQQGNSVRGQQLAQKILAGVGLQGDVSISDLLSGLMARKNQSANKNKQG